MCDPPPCVAHHAAPPKVQYAVPRAQLSETQGGEGGGDAEGGEGDGEVGEAGEAKEGAGRILMCGL